MEIRETVQIKDEPKRPKRFREKFIRIKRHWNRPEFEVTLVTRADGVVTEIQPSEELMIAGVDEEKVYVDITIEDFEKRLIEIFTDSIMLDDHLEKIKSLRWTFKEESLKKVVDEISRDVVEKIARKGFAGALAEIKKIPRQVV